MIDAEEAVSMTVNLVYEARVSGVRRICCKVPGRITRNEIMKGLQDEGIACGVLPEEYNGMLATYCFFIDVDKTYDE